MSTHLHDKIKGPKWVRERSCYIWFFQILSWESEYLENVDQKNQGMHFLPRKLSVWNFLLFNWEVRSVSKVHISKWLHEGLLRKLYPWVYTRERLFPQSLFRHIPLSSWNPSHPRFPFILYLVHSQASSPFSPHGSRPCFFPGPHTPAAVSHSPPFVVGCRLLTSGHEGWVSTLGPCLHFRPYLPLIYFPPSPLVLQ